MLASCSLDRPPCPSLLSGATARPAIRDLGRPRRTTSGGALERLLAAQLAIRRYRSLHRHLKRDLLFIITRVRVPEMSPRDRSPKLVLKSSVTWNRTLCHKWYSVHTGSFTLSLSTPVYRGGLSRKPVYDINDQYIVLQLPGCWVQAVADSR
ncbi:GSCOCG00006897001-RA-CDS [Cotesia congregata]|nr:GSCOCG00006897001-RA-CDS [Cotesia congregata]